MVAACSLLREGPAMASSLLLNPLRHISSSTSSSAPTSALLFKVRHRSQPSRFSSAAATGPAQPRFTIQRRICSLSRSDPNETTVAMHRSFSSDCLMCSWNGPRRYGNRSCFCTFAAGNPNPDPNYSQSQSQSQPQPATAAPSPNPQQPHASNPNSQQPQAANANTNPNSGQTWQQQTPQPRMQGYGANNNFGSPRGPGVNTNYPNANAPNNNNFTPQSNGPNVSTNNPSNGNSMNQSRGPSVNANNPPRTSAAAEVIDKYLGPSDLKLEKPNNINNNSNNNFTNANNYNSNNSSRRSFSGGAQEKKSGKDLVAESAACAVIEKYLGPWPGFPPRDPKIDEYLDSLPENAACAAIDKYFGPYKPLFVFKKNEENANSSGSASPSPPNRGPPRNRMMNNRTRNRTWNPQEQGSSVSRPWNPEGSGSNPTPTPPQTQTPPPSPGDSNKGHPQQ